MKIIAELGINHGGSLATAEKMIAAAAKAGCDGVKLQTYRTGDFLPKGHPDWDLFQSCEIWQHLDRLIVCAHADGLQIGTTPTSLEGVGEAWTAGVDFLKNGSDFLLRRDMILAMLVTGLETWVSTGMATWEEIRAVPDGANLMLCTSLYPCPDTHAGLIRLERIVPRPFTGFSDHTKGTTAAVIAAALGVQMIEKHFTLDKLSRNGPDHRWSASPSEMTRLVTEVHRAEVMMSESAIHQHPMPGEEWCSRDKWRVTEETLRS